MRCVVTGSAGFIGCHVCAVLLEGGHDVVGVDAFTDYYDPSFKRSNAAWLDRDDGYRGIELDLAVGALDELFDGADAVIHLAGQLGVRLSWADGFDLYVERNITAPQRVLEAVRRTAVPRVVLASSSSVYGNATGYPTTEDSPNRPFSPYGVTKLAVEQLASAYTANWGVPAVLLRYFTEDGPGQRPDMGIHRFIEATAAGEPVTVYGDGEQVPDFACVVDAAAAKIAAATSSDLEPRAVSNGAGGSTSTINEVLRLVAESVGRELFTRRVAEQPGDVRETGGAVNRARRLLGWLPDAAPSEGIKRQAVHQLSRVRA